MYDPSPSSDQPSASLKPTFTQPNTPRPTRPAPAGEHGGYQFAKWPPDDADLPGGGGLPGSAGGGSPIGPYDGDFKKGRFNPKFVLLGFVLLLIGGGLALFAVKNESAKMTVDQIASIKKNI
jgi:hypothetical protein